MNLDSIAPIKIDELRPPRTAAQPTMEQVCESIWQLTEEILELLRSHATSEVQKQKKGHVWLDDVTRAQSNTIVATKHLCDVYPEGITLKKLAETVGVTPAAASVMVDLLVTKKILKRTQSKDDRRAVLIRLTPQTSRLFEIVDQSLGQAVMTVADTLGPQVLHDWQKMLATVSSVLWQTVGGRSSAEADHYADAQPDQAVD